MAYNTKAKELKQPTTSDIKDVRMRAGLSQQRSADLVHRADGSRWREWEGGKYQIDMAVWELYLLKTGLREIEPITPTEK